MKRISVLIAMLMLALCLCACGRLEGLTPPPLPTVTPEPTEAPVATEAPKAVTDPNPTVVSISKTEKTAKDPQNGELDILSFSYETPRVRMSQRPDTARKINEYIAMLDETYYTGEDYGDGQGTGYNNMLTMAEDLYNYRISQGEEIPVCLSSDRSVSVCRADGAVFTLVYFDSNFTGGAHGMYGFGGYCFDAETGERLSLDSLSSDGAGLRSFLTECMLETVAEDDSYQERMEGFVQENDYEAALSALLRDGSWYLDREGICIFSQLYEISSYAAGIVEFNIPYEKLRGHIDDKWIPETLSCDGKLKVASAKDMKNGSLEIIDKVVVKDMGEELYLVADGQLRDIYVSSVEFMDSMGHVYETAKHWYCSSMKDCALQLETLLPEGMPDLRISFRGIDGEQVFYLSESGKDGSLILVDDSIEAKG